MEKIRLLAAKCIKGYLQPPCRACEDVCPAGAFRWGVPHPDLCIECGLCTAVCPAAAVETRLDYAAKLTAIVAVDAPSVRLACAKSASDSALPCLGFLTRGVLWAIASQKEVQLDIGTCRTCLPAVHAHLARETAAVDAALAAAGRAPARSPHPSERGGSKQCLWRTERARPPASSPPRSLPPPALFFPSFFLGARGAITMVGRSRRAPALA